MLLQAARVPWQHPVKHDTTSQPGCKFLQRVLNQSVERQTEYQCTTCAVRRKCAVENIERKSDVCNK